MIDVSQWRASIGLWNYCQAASSRPANGRHSHSFKAAVDTKSSSSRSTTTSGKNTSKLPTALSLIAGLLLLRFLFLSVSSRHIFMIPPTGKQEVKQQHYSVWAFGDKRMYYWGEPTNTSRLEFVHKVSMVSLVCLGL